MSLSEYIAEHCGLAPDLVGMLLLGLGALVLAIGASLLGLSALSLTRERSPRHDQNWRLVSKLLPLLAQDTLAPDLRAVYQKSLYLDALIQDVAPDLASPTGTALGRDVRRALLAIEARRFRADDPETVQAHELSDLRARLDRAIDAAERARPAAHVDVSALAELLQSSDADDTDTVRADAS